MNWDDLRIFLALARCGKLSETGRRLNIDHSTVARRIRSLEKAFSTTLFERKPNGYDLTASGTDLVRFAESMESIAINATSSVSDKSEQLSGPVRIASPEGIGAFAVARAAQKICEEHPNLKIELLTNAQRYSLAKRETDILISVSKPSSGRLKIQKISDVDLYLYSTRAYLKTLPPIKEIADLRHARGVSYVADLIPDEELNYTSVFESNLENQLTATSVHVQSSAILNGAGVGIMHDFMAAPHPELVKILPSKISLKRSLWAVVHEDYSELERIRVVSRAIVHQVRKLVNGAGKKAVA